MLPGIPAALFMAVPKTPLQASPSSGRLMERMMAGVNSTSRWRWVRRVCARAAEISVEKITRVAVGVMRSSAAEREPSDDIPVMAIRRGLKEFTF